MKNKTLLKENMRRFNTKNLNEQGVRMPDGAIIGPGGIMSPKEVAAAEKRLKTVFTDPHVILPILEIAALIMIPPPAGLILAAGIGLYDAKKYKDEGDKEMAAVAAVFAVLPGIGKIANYLIPGIKKLGKEGMIKLAEKISKSNNPILNDIELKVIAGIDKNKKIVNQLAGRKLKELTKRAIAAGKIATNTPAGKKIKDFVNKTVVVPAKWTAAAATAVAPVAAAGYTTLKAYDAAASAGKLGPIEYIKTIGYTKKDWVPMQTIFGTDKTGKGNMKIVAALKDGWRLGEIIPEKHQTQQYKTGKAQEAAALKSLYNEIAKMKATLAAGST